MMQRTMKRGFALVLALLLAILLVEAIADEDAEEMRAYWGLVGDVNQPDALTKAMNEDYDNLTLEELKAVTPEQLLAFAAQNQLPISMARYGYYAALADRLALEVPQTPTGERLALFLDMKDNPRDKDAKAQRRAIRKELTEQDILGYADETELPAGFLAWLMLDDEWHEGEWEDSDDWREGRRDWDFADWVDEQDLIDLYGREARVTDDDVERVLRKNGLDFDD